MKKVLLTMVLMLAGMTAGAQEIGTEIMEHIEVKGDPMLGTKDRKIWKSEHATIEQTKMGACIILTATDNVFLNKGTKIGIYNKKDSLIGMSSHIGFTQVDSSRTRLHIVGAVTSHDSIPNSRKDIYGLYNIPMDNALWWVHNNDGTLRIVTHVYGDYFYDIRLKFNKEE